MKMIRAAVLSAFLFVSGSAAHAISCDIPAIPCFQLEFIVDTCSVDASATDQIVDANPVHAAVASAGAIGGLRKYSALMTQGGSGVTASTSGGACNHSNGSLSVGRTTFTYDGSSDPFNLNTSGLAKDFTPTTDRGVRFFVRSFTYDSLHTVSIKVTLNSPGGRSSQGTVVLNRDYANEPVDLPFSNFGAVSGGGVDYANVGAISVEYSANTSNVNFPPSVLVLQSTK